MRRRNMPSDDLDGNSREYPGQPSAPTDRRPAAVGALAVLLVVALGVVIFISMGVHRPARGAPGASATETPTATLAPTVGVSKLQAPRHGAGLPHGVEVITFVLTGTAEGWGTGGANINPLYGTPDRGMVLHYSSGSWTQVGASLPGAYLSGIDMVSSSEGWVTGLDSNDKSLLLHISNGAWQQVPPPAVDPRGAPGIVAMRTPDEGWMVVSNLKGEQGGANTSLLHYADGVWSMISNPLHFITDIAPVADGEAWTVGWNTDGSSSLVHVQGGTATVVLTSPGNSTFTRLRMFAPNDIWIEGAIHASTNVSIADESLVYHFDGTAWSTVNLHVPNGVQAVGIVASNTAWSFASVAEATPSPTVDGHIASIYSNAGSQWKALSVPYKDLQTIYVISDSSTDVWAIGVYMVTTHTVDGTASGESGVSHYVLLHYTGGLWTEYGR
ncbi:MAG TPA: hypothetical protein VGF38_03705 [Ktedonobacterales bacterium]|jgi:hypothetical protein